MDQTTAVEPDQGGTLDAVSRDHFRDQLQSAIDNGTLARGGWQISVGQYDIPLPGGDAHTAIEIRGPEGFYASIDTFTLDNEGNATFYTPGSEMRLAIDQDRAGNWVTNDENLIERHVVYEGQGEQALLEFARMAEQAQAFNSSGADYHPYSWDSLTGIFTEKSDPEMANSNSGPIQILDNLGYNVTTLRDPELEDGFLSQTIPGAGYYAPGADDDVSSLFKSDISAFFESVPDSAAGALSDPESAAYDKFVTMMRNLHPDSIAEDMKAEDTPEPDSRNDHKAGQEHDNEAGTRSLDL